MGTSWTNPVAPGISINAFDIQELINATNTNRANASPPLPPFPWTDPTVSANTPIKAVHFTELRTAIQDLLNRKNMGNIPNWSSGIVPATGTAIFASNTTDVCRWLNTYEDFNSVSGPKRGIHLNSGGNDLRECDRDFLNQQFLTVTPRRRGMVVALWPQMGPTMIAYLKSIQADSEIFIRYMRAALTNRFPALNRSWTWTAPFRCANCALRSG